MDSKEKMKKIIHYIKGEQSDLSTLKEIASFLNVNYSNFIQAKNGSKNYFTENFIDKLIEKFPGLNRDWVITGQGDMINNSDLLIKEVESFYKKDTESVTNKNGNRFEENSDGSYTITVQEVPFVAYASYVETIERGLTPAEFDEVQFVVDKFAKGNYLAFKVKGDSMNGGLIDDTPDGASILARELGRQHWIDGFNETKYGWVIICEQGIFHKDIIGMDKENGTITCHSRNKSPEYSDFELELNRVKQIFKVIKREF